MTLGGQPAVRWAATRGQVGSAAATTMVLVGVLVTATVMVGALGGVIADQRRVEAAADLAALAAAGALRAGEDPCPAAGSIARRNGAALAGCAVAREVVRVRVNRRTHPLLGRTFTVTAQARAGPVS